jgi:uncharacterized protein (TIRG00374 family)
VKRTRLLIGLILATLVGNLIYTVMATDRAAVAAALEIRAPMLVLALVLALVPWLCNSLRTLAWLRLMRPDLPDPAALSLRSVLAAEVGAAVTPTAFGGAPFKVGVLIRGGLGTAEALMVSAAGTLEEVVVALAALPLALVATGLGDQVLSWLREAAVRSVGHVSIAAVVAGLIAVTAALVLPRSARGRRLAGRVRKWGCDIHDLVIWVHRRGRLVFALNVLLAAVHLAARMSIVTALMAGLGLAVEPLHVAMLQWVCFTLMAVTPTPGAIGGAEGSFLLIFADVVPAPVAPVVMVVWRFVTFYAVNGLALVLLAMPRPWRWRWPEFTRPAKARG